MSERLHVHVPFSLLEKHLPLLLERGLQPEIALKWPDLVGDHRSAAARAAQRLGAAGLRVTVHGPFMDLNPGALEPMVRQATMERFRQTLAMAEWLEARLVVFHPGYEFWRYGGRSELWVEACREFWPPLIEQAATQDCPMVLENIFEDSPDTLKDLLDAFASPWLGHCFDIGHWRLFSKVTMADWFNALGPHLRHLHLHDNSGDRDAHLAIGEGNIDFAELARLLPCLPEAPCMTLEIHDCPALLRCLDNFPPSLRI